jgi:flagellar basal body-associated protein FliL
MMPAEAFEPSCNYIRIISLVMGFILFLTAMLVLWRPTSKKIYSDAEANTRAVVLYVKRQEEQKSHLVWLLVICAIVIWYLGTFISSSYLSDAVVQKAGECEFGSPEANTYAEYNTWLLFPPILFAAGLALSLIGTATRGGTSKTVHALSYFLILLGTISVILLFRYIDICTISAKCL